MFIHISNALFILDGEDSMFKYEFKRLELKVNEEDSVKSATCHSFYVELRFPGWPYTIVAVDFLKGYQQPLHSN